MSPCQAAWVATVGGGGARGALCADCACECRQKRTPATPTTTSAAKKIQVSRWRGPLRQRSPDDGGGPPEAGGLGPPSEVPGGELAECTALVPRSAVACQEPSERTTLAAPGAASGAAAAAAAPLPPRS